MLTDEPVKNGLVPRRKVRVLVGAKHIPSAHARIAFLVGVRLHVEGLDGAYIIGYQFFIAVSLHLVGVVLFVIHLLFLRAIGFQLGIPSSDTYLSAFLHTILLFAVLMLGTFFTRVPGVTPADQGENGTGLHQAVGKVTYQVVFHFQFGGDIHAVPVQGLEHVSHAVQKQLGSLVPVVGISYHSTAHYIVGIIGFHTVAILHWARQVAVVKRNLTQGIFTDAAQMIRAVSIVEVPLAHVQLAAKGLVLGIVQVVGYRGRTQYQRISILVGKVCRVQHLAGLGVI